MLKKSFNKAGGVSLLVAALWGNHALAATATATMNVSATVAAACQISVNPMTFGAYNPLTNVAVSTTSTVTATCTSGTPYNIGIDAGGGTGATVANRKMTSGTALLTYSLYQDAAFTTVWGNTVGTDTVTSTGTGNAQIHTVYGKINASQNVPTGSYNDVVNVTITY